MQQIGIITNDMILSDTLNCENTPVLVYQLHYPQFQTSDPGVDLSPINMYYEEKAMVLEYYAKNTMYPQAAQQYRYSKKHGYPVMTYEMLLNYNITLMTEKYISLYYDLYQYTGGAHGNTTRFSNTWNIDDGQIILLGDFFTTNPSYEEDIIRSIIAYISRQVGAPDSHDSIDYFGDYKQNVAKNFDANNFYLTPQGIVIYFQHYDIAPYSSGIPEFLIASNLITIEA